MPAEGSPQFFFKCKKFSKWCSLGSTQLCMAPKIILFSLYHSEQLWQHWREYDAMKKIFFSYMKILGVRNTNLIHHERSLF